MAHEKPPLSLSPAQRIVALADQCVQCGLCLPVCPTYALDGNEAESPRGRIAIAAALARGDAQPTEALREHLDHCLGCLGCERVCPANVHYGELIVQTRNLIGPSPRRQLLLQRIISRPAWLKWADRAARSLGLPAWARWLPTHSSWRAALTLLTGTRTTSAAMPAMATPASAAPHVALFPGCVASIEDADAQRAAIHLLRAAGYAVTQLPAFCCGAMDFHGGDATAAETASQRVRQSWNDAGATQLVSITPGCLGALRHALPGVPVVDPFTLLAARAEQLHFHPLTRRVALHVPCTQANVARSEAAMLSLLQRVPSLDVVSVPRPPHCCGAAGTHMLEFPERAARLRDDVLQQVAGLAPAQLLSSNIGCRLHLAAGMDTDGRAWPHQHPLTLLAQQLETAP